MASQYARREAVALLLVLRVPGEIHLPSHSGRGIA